MFIFLKNFNSYSHSATPDFKSQILNLKLVDVVVTGIGLISALGNNLESSWQRLISGESAIDLHQPFPELQPRPLALIGQQPAELTDITQQVVSMALDDAGLVSHLPDCGVVIGSSRSFQGKWEELSQSTKADFFPKILPFSHLNAINTAHQIGATGIVLAPMAACATGIWAIFQGFNLIKTGECNRVIAGAVEAPITPLTITGFQQMGALAKTGSYPFDLNREGLVLGEGAAVFILESEELAKQRNAKVYGRILGFGLTADAYHPNAPDPQGKMASFTIKQCLQRAGLTFEDIDYIHAHGTGTELNDKIESKIIQNLFHHNVAVSSTKGATGHTLGASGALGTAFSLMAFKKQILPPSVGLKKSEFDLNFVTEANQVNEEIRRSLCFSFGFGGQNAVIALGQI